MSYSISIPNVEDYFTNEHGILNFTLANSDISIANALRRTMLTDIPCVVIKTDDFKHNDLTIHINTSKLNNEIIRQRLSCIPIHIKDLELAKNLTLELDIKNNTDSIIYVTTEHIKVKTIDNKYLSEKNTRDIFPKNKFTDDFIIINRLRPKISNDIHGEHLKFTSKLSIGTAKESGAFNMVSTCSYGFTKDESKIKNIIIDKKINLKDENKSDDEINLIINNWLNHDAKRIFKPNSYDFKIETIGVYTNEEILMMAIKVLIQKFNNIKQSIIENKYEFLENITINPNTVDIKLFNEGYTTGKCIEYILHDKYFKNSDILSYVGFIHEHPHYDYTTLRLTINNNNNFNNEFINKLLLESCDDIIKIFNSIKL